jgi:hypothetical protein
MLETRANLTAFRSFMVAVCLAFISGCGPGTAIPPAAIPLAAVPANLMATAGNAVVTLTWTASSGATSYNVKRATTAGGPYTQLASSSSAGYADSSVTNGTAYYYVVSALNAGGESANSAQASATPAAAASAPAAPTNLTATSGNAQISLTWSASSGATSYHVKRATVNGGPYTQIAAPTSTSYLDTALSNGTTYYYVVSAVNAVGESANSAQASAAPSSPISFGTWIDVTPSNVDLTDSLDCQNYGTQTVQADPVHPSNTYTQFHCQGIWKSIDYGATWTGPINTGTNGSTVGDCAGGITISPTSMASVPTIYESCIRGSGLGLWKSVDGGVTWTNYAVTPTPSRQDYNPPVVDPYDQNHLLMTGHEQNSVVQSTDGGQTWAAVSIAPGMVQGAFLTGYISFIDTGNSSTTRGTWLWLAQQSGGIYGTWRTTDSGGTWVQVDTNEHPGGSFQIYQPDTSGVLFMAGTGSALGQGVLRSTDFGQTWSHVGLNEIEDVVYGTSKYVYSGYGAPVGPTGTTDPSFEVAAQPGTGTWTAPGTPTGLFQGPAQFAVVNDGTHNILLGAMWNAGLWRYIEP